MITFEQFTQKPTKHVVTKDMDKIWGWFVFKGDVYYTNGEGRFHNLDGPAIEHRPTGGRGAEWFIDGVRLIWHSDPHYNENGIWLLLKANIPNNLEILNFVGMNNEMQEYICQHRPDLIGRIKDLDPSLAEKYREELELGRTDL